MRTKSKSPSSARALPASPRRAFWPKPASTQCCSKRATGSAGRAHAIEHDGIGLDLGCGYLHSGDINPWTTIAETLGFEINRCAPPWAEDSRHYGARLNADIDEAWDGFYERLDELEDARLHDSLLPDLPCSAAFEPGNPFNPMLDAMSGLHQRRPVEPRLGDRPCALCRHQQELARARRLRHVDLDLRARSAGRTQHSRAKRFGTTAQAWTSQRRAARSARKS